jgi:hypothetical protein
MDPDQRVVAIQRTARTAAGRIVEVNQIILPAHQWELVYTRPGRFLLTGLARAGPAGSQPCLGRDLEVVEIALADRMAQGLDDVRGVVVRSLDWRYCPAFRHPGGNGGHLRRRDLLEVPDAGMTRQAQRPEWVRP